MGVVTQLSLSPACRCLDPAALVEPLLAAGVDLQGGKCPGRGRGKGGRKEGRQLWSHVLFSHLIVGHGLGSESPGTSEEVMDAEAWNRQLV